MIRINRSRIMYVFGLTALFIAAVPIVAMAADSKPAMYATIWAVLPPIVAIGLASSQKKYTARCSSEFLQEDLYILE